MQMNRKEFAGGLASLMVVGCSAGEKNKIEVQMPVKVKKDKILFVYFSRSGNTRYATETFAKACGGAKTVEVKAEKPYAPEYNACCEEARPECRAKTLRTIQKIEGLDLAAYDVVFFGTPDWWGTMCPPIRTFITQNLDVLKTKTLCIYQTHGGGGMENVGRDFEALVAGAKILPPKAFYGSTIKMGIGLKAFIADRLAVEA